MVNLTNKIEAIIFAASHPVTTVDLLRFLSVDAFIQEADIQTTLQTIREKYADAQYSFELVYSGGGYQFRTKASYHDDIAAFLQRDQVKKLTTAALETLAIIAYRQPVSKSEMESIRGVSCDYTVQKLMERELVEIKGRSEEVGRPLLYGTSEYFLDYFGINSVDELPKLKEFQEPENQIGEKENIVK